jgi:hypothetical protein
MLLRALAFVFVLSACSPGPAPISRSMNDPSNPSAPEGMNPIVMPTPAASAAASASAAPAPHHHHHHEGQ